MMAPMTIPFRTWWAALLAILVVAAVLRVWNLGTFSLWLDEIFTVTVADQKLVDTLASCAQDAENVPVYAVLANIGIALGAGETALRIAPIASGLAAIVLLAVWTRRHFSGEIALTAAAFCALSPFHVRYSQELRAYPYLMLVSVLTLLAADRLRERPDWRSTMALAFTVALGCYTHLTYLMVLVPAAGSLLLPTPAAAEGAGRPNHAGVRFSLALGAGLAAFAPWMWLISRNLVERMPRSSITEWSLAVIGDRWHVLTVSAWEHDAVGWSSLLIAGLALTGFVIVLTKPVGTFVFVPAVFTVIVWESFLVAIHHWSSSRYTTALWSLLAVLVAVGFHRILTALPWRGLRFTVCAAAAVLLLTHVEGYYERGRPHWDRVAAVVRDARRVDEPVVANSHWTRRCVSYYLGETIPTVADRPERLAPLMDCSPSILLVSRTESPPVKLLEVASHATELAAVPNTAWLHRLEQSQEVTAIDAARSPP